VAAYRAGVEERARRAELDRVRAEGERAKAEAEAREQRKRQKVQLALATAVALLLAAGGAFAWWDQKRDSDQARTETARLAAETDAREKQQAVERRVLAGWTAAAGLLDQAEAALRAGDAARAAVPLTEAGLRIDEGGADDLRPRRSRCQAELAMLLELDGIDNDRCTVTDGKLPPWQALEPRFAKAFASYGITPGVTPPGEAAERITNSLIRERLLTSLEVWFVDGDREPALRATLAAADPDEFRNEARATSYQRAVLARSSRGQPPPTAQPIWFVIGHAQDQSLGRALREQLLLAVHRGQPNHFLILMSLGSLAERGDHAAALDKDAAAACAGWFRAAIAVQPGNLAAWANLGVALFAAGDLPGAVAAYKESIRLDPKNARAHRYLGDVVRAAGDLPGAVAAYNDSIRLDPKDAGAHNNLGIALLDSGDLPGAVAAHKEAIRLDPNDAKAHTNLGNALRTAGDLPGALAALREATRLDPKDAKAHTNLGIALRAAGDLPGAVAAYKDSIRLDPKDARTHTNLGNALLDSGDLPGAVAAHKEAIRLGLKDARPHTNLGAVYFRLKKYSDAIACAQEAVRIDPNYATAHALLGRSLQSTGDLSGARAALIEAARLDPKRWGLALAMLPPLAIAPPPRPVGGR
jgi:Flp pilus assembly protein TadD